MLLLDLFEAPISDMQFHGDWSDMTSHDPHAYPEGWTHGDPDGRAFDGNNSFVSVHDRRLVTNPRIQERTKALMKNFPHDIKIYFINDPKMEHFFNNLDTGLIDEKSKDWYRIPQSVDDQLQSRGKNEISIILTHNEGGDTRQPLTPWMIIHRIAHALPVWKTLLYQESTILRLINSFANCYAEETFDDTGEMILIKIRGRAVSTSMPNFFNQLCTFKSARDKKIDNATEAMCDLFVQWAIGGIKFYEPPAIFSNLGKYHLVERAKAIDILEEIKDEISATFKRISQDSCGKIFVS